MTEEQLSPTSDRKKLRRGTRVISLYPERVSFVSRNMFEVL